MDPVSRHVDNTFYIAGICCVLLSIVVPGADVGTSTTTQTFLAETVPHDDAARSAMADMTAFLAHVVGDEDLPTSAFQQQVMRTGLLGEVRAQRRRLAALSYVARSGDRGR